MLNLLLSFNMMILFALLLMSSALLFYLNLTIMLEWLILEVNSMNIKFILMFDWISMLFISFIMLISSMIMLYTTTYMSGDKQFKQFNYLLFLFIMSMILMVISPNVISILLGWDGLGMTSYCLIMYYHNYSSYNSAMVTVLCNRVGDVGILMTLSLMMTEGNWDLSTFKESGLNMTLMALAAITKSAQIPFSVWLPMAMAAPTPVSALVHSSTLVTAGVYLMIRFQKFIMSTNVNTALCFISVTTMFMAGLMANFENDFKKIIALSTLSQLGLMMMILSMGQCTLAFYHLLTHAIFKSMLFMAAGTIIHSMNNNQDIRMLGNLNESMPFTMMSLMISNLALGGAPFFSGFYSKDLIMEYAYSNSNTNVMMTTLIIMSLMLTITYSVRFSYYMFFNKTMKFYSYTSLKESPTINLSMMIMMLLSVSIGSMMNWAFFFDLYLIFMNTNKKLMTLTFSLVGIIIMALILSIMCKLIKLNNHCCCMPYYLMFVSSMWFLTNTYTWIYIPSMQSSINSSNMDKTWVEFMSKNTLLKFTMKKIMNIQYKLHTFMFTFTYVSICLYMWF